MQLSGCSLTAKRQVLREKVIKYIAGIQKSNREGFILPYFNRPFVPPSASEQDKIEQEEQKMFEEAAVKALGRERYEAYSFRKKSLDFLEKQRQEELRKEEEGRE